MTTSLPFVWIDVFTDTPLSGNPLPVVEEADALSEETMRRLAVEFAQSETTFVLRPTLPGAHRRLRSFTPTGTEVTGAGHNTLGAWWQLAQAGRIPLEDGATTWVQEIGGRALDVVIDAEGGRPTGIRQFQTSPTLEPTGPWAAELASALGLEAGDMAAELPAQTVSTGAAHLMVPIADAAAVDRAQPDADRLREILRRAGGQGCYLFAPAPPGSDAHAYTRFFNPTAGITEDPATGSAAGPLAAYLQAHHRVASGEVVTIDQGHVMGRPSRVTVHTDGGRIALVGRAALLAEGTLHLPPHLLGEHRDSDRPTSDGQHPQ